MHEHVGIIGEATQEQRIAGKAPGSRDSTAAARHLVTTAQGGGPGHLSKRRWNSAAASAAASFDAA